ncbi:MAG: arginine repressor [Actinomycetota bacterium]|nr:arginine repressor [Actinomycetota bacterium]
MAAPLTRSARHARIIALIEAGTIHSQADLAAALHADGVEVTQATLSRDLDELGAVKLRGVDGEPASYVLPQEGGSPLRPARRPPDALVHRLGDLLIGVEASANLVVVRTPPGAAQFLASAVDKAGLPATLGTIAGDDTVLVITRDPDGGPALAAQLAALADRGRGSTADPKPSSNYSNYSNKEKHVVP